MIPFNKPYTAKNSLNYIAEAIKNGSLCGNGPFTKKCQTFFENTFGFKKTIVTTSCTDALEMCALLLDIKPEDEVIVPSYTFVSSALAFARQGARIVFADSRSDHPGINEDSIEELVTPKTKAIVAVHYAGVACDMDKIMRVADKHSLCVIEDAALAINSSYKGRPLGGIGHLGTFSFHETKSVQCGEGGMLVINDDRFKRRAEIIWEKGTNRAAFFRGEINKYGWVDTGSSFLPSEITAAFLYGQLEELQFIQKRREEIWRRYYDELVSYREKGTVQFQFIPEYASNNSHMFFLLFENIEKRTVFISKMKEKGCAAAFHYLPLHKSEFYKDKHDGRPLLNAGRYSDTLVRLPFYHELWGDELQSVICAVKQTLGEIK